MARRDKRAAESTVEAPEGAHADETVDVPPSGDAPQESAPHADEAPAEVEALTDEAPPADVEAPADEAPLAAEASEAELAEGDVTVVMAIEISGLRNGVPWPAVGESITLPAVEAEGYIQFGYVREV